MGGSVAAGADAGVTVTTIVVVSEPSSTAIVVVSVDLSIVVMVCVAVCVTVSLLGVDVRPLPSTLTTDIEDACRASNGSATEKGSKEARARTLEVFR